MNDIQILTILLSTVPTMLVVLVGILVNNSRLGDVTASMNIPLNGVNTRIAEVGSRLTNIETKFDTRFDMC